MKIVILSRNHGLYSTQRIIFECRKKNIKVETVDLLTCNIVLDGNNSAIILNDGRKLTADVVIPRIGVSVTNFGAAILRHIELIGIPSTTTADALLQSRDKLITLQLCAKHGLPVPKSFLSSPLELSKDLIKNNFELPLIIKLLESTHGLGVILSDNYLNAIATGEAFQKIQQKFIFQKFIQESAGQDIRAFVIGDRVVASMLRKATNGEFRSNIHRGAEAIPVLLTDDEEKMAVMATKILGLQMSGVDFMRTEKGPIILEVNASPGLEGIEGATNINIAGAIVQYASSLAVMKKEYGT